MRRRIAAAGAKLLGVVAVVGVSRWMVVHPSSLRAMRMKSGDNPDTGIKNLYELPHGDAEGMEISATIGVGIGIRI